MPGDPHSRPPRLRITGYACSAVDPPVRSAYLPMGDLTILMGPNDSGKSTLLRSLHRDLHGGHFSADRESDRNVGGIFYAEVSDAELESLIRATAGGSDRRSVAPGDRGARPPYDEGLWHLGLPAHELTEDPIGKAISAVETPADGTTRAEILRELSQSRIVGFECAGHDAGGVSRVWNVYWCLRPLDEVPSAVREELPISGLWPHARAAEPVKAGLRRISAYVGLYGTPRHLDAPGAPIAVVALGATTHTAMPLSVAAPTSFDVLRQAAIDTGTLLTNTMRHGLDDARSDGMPLLPDEAAKREAPRAWLTECDDDGVALSDEARGAFSFLSLASNRRLPGFLASRYSIQVAVRPVAEWFANDALELLTVARRDDHVIQDFQIDRAAEGYRLWLQLALLSGLNDGDRIARLLAGHAEDCASAAMGVDESRGEDDWAAAATEQAWRSFADGTASVIELDTDQDSWVNDDLANATDNVFSTSPTGLLPRAGRLFVVDEPERHLHPRLQRQAADWVAETAATTGSPFVLATHSAAFLNLAPEAATYVSISRIQDQTRLQVFDPVELNALSAFSAEMGYDRGELAAAVAVWLIVEGVTDRAVLETLYGQKLREHGIAVVPIHGIAKWQVLLDSDALWRFFSAPVVVMFDGLSADLVARLKASSDDELVALEKDAKERHETQLAAKLIRGLGERGRSLTLVPNEDADVFAGLADEAIKAVFTDYPGHEAAEAAWVRHKKGTHDAFLKRKYGVEKDAAKFTQIAREMRTRSLRSESLERAIAFCAEVANEPPIGVDAASDGLVEPPLNATEPATKRSPHRNVDDPLEGDAG